MITNSLVKVLRWKADSYSIGQDITSLHWIQRLILEFIKALHSVLSWSRRIRSTKSGTLVTQNRSSVELHFRVWAPISLVGPVSGRILAICSFRKWLHLPEVRPRTEEQRKLGNLLTWMYVFVAAQCCIQWLLESWVVNMWSLLFGVLLITAATASPSSFMGESISAKTCQRDQIKRISNQEILIKIVLSRNHNFNCYFVCVWNLVSLTLRNAYRVRVFENRVWRKIFGPKRK